MQYRNLNVHIVFNNLEIRQLCTFNNKKNKRNQLEARQRKETGVSLKIRNSKRRLGSVRISFAIMVNKLLKINGEGF